MPSVIKTNKGRILDLPICINDITHDESIVATNAGGGRLFVETDENDVDWLKDASLLEDESGDFNFISLPLIEDQQIDEERASWDLAAKLKQINDIENEKYD